MKKISFIHRISQPRPLYDAIPEPHYVVEDATLPIRVLASRFVRGELNGVNVHEAQYSTELSPIVSKGVDLCDFSDIKRYYDDMSKTQKTKYDSITKQINALAEQIRTSKKEQPSNEQPKGE